MLNKWIGFSLILLVGGCSALRTSQTNADRDKAKLHLQVATDEYNRREYNKAVESVQQALKLDPSLAPAYNHLALIYLETRRFSKSEEAFNKALQLQPNYPEVQNNMGVLYNRQERFREAIPFFEKALSDSEYLTPENALTNIGYSYYRLGDLKRAKSFQEKALDVSPMFCLAAKNLGDVYAKQKAFNRAADSFEKALTHCPLFQEAQYKLGLVLVRMGKKRVAKVQLEKLVERHKKGPYVERSNEVLRYLH